jgi:short-subunit dehydrogenase
LEYVLLYRVFKKLEALGFAMDLAGKIVVITGAARGIGLETALLLAKNHARIFAIDIDPVGLNDLEDAFSRFGYSIKTFAGSVTDHEFMRSVREKVLAETKYIDIWINNAGVAQIKSFLQSSADEFQRVIDINFHSVVAGTRLALEVMENRGFGLIVNVGSVAGYLPAPLMSSYNASKFAVVGFTKSIQAELNYTSSPVKMMLVSPGFVDTQIVAKGQEQGFPDWLGFMLSTAKDVARDIVVGIKRGKTEISPTLNGKLMRKMYSVFPDATVRSSRILLSKNLKDFLTNKTSSR